MSDVVVESVEITDLGAQARGSRVFGLHVGDDTRLSFEVLANEYDAAVTFALIGVLEGIRHGGAAGVLRLPHDATLTLDPGDSGITVIANGIESWHPTWNDALYAVVGVVSGVPG